MLNIRGESYKGPDTFVTLKHFPKDCFKTRRKNSNNMVIDHTSTEWSNTITTEEQLDTVCQYHIQYHIIFQPEEYTISHHIPARTAKPKSNHEERAHKTQVRSTVLKRRNREDCILKSIYVITQRKAESLR